MALLITHDFPSVEQADAFAHDPGLREGMARAGVVGAPRIEIFASVRSLRSLAGPAQGPVSASERLG